MLFKDSYHWSWNIILFFFSKKKTPSISYKILQMRVLYTNPCRDAIVPLMWMPTDSRKVKDDHCWMKASCCLSTPSDPPLRPSYWLFRVATTSFVFLTIFYFKYINIPLPLHHGVNQVAWIPYIYKWSAYTMYKNVEIIKGIYLGSRKNNTWIFEAQPRGC